MVSSPPTASLLGVLRASIIRYSRAAEFSELLPTMAPTQADRSQQNALSARARWGLLAAIVIGAVLLRIPGLDWLVDIGPNANQSFYLDDQRFVDLADNIAVGMHDGYVYGMTTHLIWIRSVLSTLLPDVSELQFLRVVTLVYGALTFLLTFALARRWTQSDFTALFAALFLGIAPLHVAVSNYGTADVTVVFYSYATLYAAINYLESRNWHWFLLTAALSGIAIAMKLFLSLLLPLFLLILTYRGRHLILQTAIAAAVAIFSFELFSLFEYGIGDLLLLLDVLRADVVTIPGGNGPFRQLVLYTWDMISVLSLPVTALLIIGIVAAVIQYQRAMLQYLRALSLRDWRRFITPQLLLVATFVAHAFLLLSAGAHAARHLLVFVPLCCIGAAYGLSTIFSRKSDWSRMARVTVVCVLVGYGVANAAGLEALYVKDIRVDIAKWVDEITARGEKVLSVSDWTHVRHATFSRGTNLSSAEVNAYDYLIVCDLEYQGHLRSRNNATYQPYGGQPRTDFFWAVAENRSPFRIVKVFHHGPFSLEQALIDRQILRPVGTFIPKTCVALTQKPEEAPVANPPAMLPRIYFSSGW